MLTNISLTAKLWTIKNEELILGKMRRQEGRYLSKLVRLKFDIQL